MRAFIAFKLPETVISALGALQSDLKKSGLNLRWVRPENIHLTLKFLGEIDSGRQEALSAAVNEVAAGHHMLTLHAGGLGVFPTVRKARVLWSGVHGETDRLRALYDDLQLALAPIGFAPENRTFRAHLTLGRVKGHVRPQRLVAAIAAHGAFATASFTAGHLTLFRSDLQPSGAVYTAIAGADLRRAGDAGPAA